jgi:Glyoxalase-like domain
LELDHVLIAVADLGEAAREFEARYGLASVEGGRHPGWGTANRIVPLGESYLELVAVVDGLEAAQSAFGRWVAAVHPEPGGRPFGWAMRTHDLDEVARRLSLTIEAGSRAAPSGQLLRWRSAGIEQSAAESALPFFIEWGQGMPLPGRAAVTHRPGSVAITRLELAGDADRLAAWLDNHRLPIAVLAGGPAVRKVILTGAAGEFVIGDDDRQGR